MKNIFSIIVILSIIQTPLFAQNYSNPKAPTLSDMRQQQQVKIQQQNGQHLIKHGGHPPPTQSEIKYKAQTNQQHYKPPNYTQKQKSIHMVNSLLAEHEKKTKYDTITYKVTRTYNGTFRFTNTSSQEYKSTLPYYETAFQEISKMLEGKSKIDLKRVVYLVENVVLKDQVSYSAYLEKIEQLKNYTKRIAEKEAVDFNTSLGKHFAIQRLYSDTTNQAFHYDFNDIYGYSSYTQQFVTKLLFTGTGQCRSMPLMYLILAQEFGVEAYLSFSPKHSYVMFQNGRTWYNFETTNGCLTTQQWVAGSGFVKAESIQTKTYLNPKNNQEVLAHLLKDLATTYRLQLGYDNFLGEMIDKSLVHFHHMHVVMEKANF